MGQTCSSSSGRGNMMEKRGQMFALEGVLAALVVLAGIAFALQATVLTPTTSGATAAPVDGSAIDSVLSTTVENGEFRSDLTEDWTSSGFDDATGRWYTDTYPYAFGDALNQTLGPSAVANVVIHHRSAAEGRQRTRLVYNGAPGNGAVRASTVLTLYDRDVCSSFPCDPDERTKFFAEDIDTSSDGHVYNVIEVEVVAWQA